MEIIKTEPTESLGMRLLEGLTVWPSHKNGGAGSSTEWCDW